MNYNLIVAIPPIIVIISVVMASFRVLSGELGFGSIRSLMIFMIISLGLISIWLYIVRDEQVFMSNLSIIADVFKNRLDTITGPEVILLVILGVILFKKTA